MRLRRSDLARPGYRRRRRGRGVTFLDTDGRPLTDHAELARLRELVIPPAWRDVWISPHPAGHIQAVGTDAAGRRQYLYHPQWRARRDTAKFEHVRRVAERLPRLRRRVAADLRGGGLRRERVLATVVRLLDLGMFRIGSDQYADGDDPTFGVATLRSTHTRVGRGCVVLDFPAKGGIPQVRRITDPQVCAVLRDLRRRRTGEQRLFCYWDGRQWREVHSDEINSYLRAASGTDMTAKDFRTWHATVRAATTLARGGVPRSTAARRRAVAAAMRDVADLLGNTPTVARASYVDPRVVELFHRGHVVRLGRAAVPDDGGGPPSAAAEDAVRRLLPLPECGPVLRPSGRG
ncbi:DNA topoisomerase IB [Solwaraspora sp. WMMD406]|uniref:DNA topoisomerase IB n=1 Tax=Solwaraspora sp. WMMD406 TaxID=3016095 RepID=UPI0024163324|nr:DNA topoisomerase IB [Solwaraspora sp. WMMD406]MDG4766595.1 DNA topoisomerase IB [Solwaraspora sp. WMMD406]